MDGEKQDKIQSEVGKLTETQEVIPADVKHLIQTGMEKYFEMRGKEISLEEQKTENNKEIELQKIEDERFKFSIKSALLLILMATFITLSIIGYLTPEVAIALGIGIGVMFNIDVLSFIK